MRNFLKMISQATAHLFENVAGARQDVEPLCTDAESASLLSQFDAAWAKVPRQVDWSQEPAVASFFTELLAAYDIANKLAEKADPDAEDIDFDHLQSQIWNFLYQVSGPENFDAALLDLLFGRQVAPGHFVEPEEQVRLWLEKRVADQ